MSGRVLTRFDDVLAALKEPSLVQTGESGPVDAEEQKRKRAEVLGALPASNMDEWRAAMLPIAREMLDQLPDDRPVELVSEFLRPWCQAITPVIMKEYVKPLAIGLTDTLPSFLANALRVLIENRGPFDASPRAVEELLRYAGTVHTLLRTATEDVEVGGTRVSAGERLILKVAEANHDPERFPEPDRLDAARSAGGHVALGAGTHSCAGAVAVRLATAVIVEAFALGFSGIESAGGVQWHEGSTKKSPDTLPVLLRRAPAP